jgi:LacI family transcriptional regulator
MKDTLMAVTLKDIAERAKIDTGAVSRTLRNHPEAQRLRPETRERIVKIAKELGYQCNPLASAVRTGTVATIAVVGKFDGGVLPFSVAQVLAGILSESVKHGYGVKIYSEDDLAKTFAEIKASLIKNVISMTIDYPEREESARLAEKYQMKLVFAHEHSVGGFPAVNVDNFYAASQAVRHLIQSGHKRIGLLCATHKFHYQRQRHKGYLHALAEAGIEPVPELISCTEEKEEAVYKMLALPVERRPTALFGISDPLVLRAQICAVRRGLKLPEELSTFGFGNFESCELAFTPLSTVDERLSKCGEIMVKIILGKDCQIEPDDNGNYLVKPKFVFRDSVACIS